MIAKVNVARIVRDHFSTLIDDRTKTLRVSDVILFLVLPIVVAAIMVVFGLHVKADFAEGLLTAMSVFSALLFNLLLLILDLLKKARNEEIPAADQVETVLLKKRKSDKLRLVKETYYNVSFGILGSITVVLLLIVYYFDVSSWSIDIADGAKLLHVGLTLDFLIFTTLAIFVGTLLMILKRIHALLSMEH